MVEEGRQKEASVEIIVLISNTLLLQYPDTYLFILTEDALFFFT